MKVKNEIRKKIISDNQFSLELALALNITQAALKIRAKRNGNGLDSAIALPIYEKYGFKEIYEDE